MGRDADTANEHTIGVSAEFFPVSIDSLGAAELTMDLFIKPGACKPVLYMAKGSTYDLSDCANLTERGITHFFVRTIDHRAVQELIGQRISVAYNDPDLCRAERSRIVRDSCGQMIAELMYPHTSCGAGASIMKLAEQFASWCTEDESKFSYLLDMSEHDFYTITHMVNVGVGCGLLAAELFGSDDARVRDITHGGLVHDVGKRDVPSGILNKEGKLSDQEWLAIRAHPEHGYKQLMAQPEASETALDMTLNHHERLNGSGYPRGLPGDQISLPARICAIVDVYDALTAARPYRGPLPPFRVLDMMREDVGTAFDTAVFDGWERVITRLLEQDPERAVVDSGQPARSLADLMPMPEHDSIRLRDSSPRVDPDSTRGGAPEETPVACAYVKRAGNRGPVPGQTFAATLIARDDQGFVLQLDHPAVVGDRILLRSSEASAIETGEVKSVHFDSCGGIRARFVSTNTQDAAA